jgi:VanZ family protein
MTRELLSRGRKLAVASWLLCWAVFGFPWTNFSPHAQWSAVTWVPWLTLDHVDDEGLNFFFYVPLGFFIFRRRNPLCTVIVCSVGFSGATEASQIFSIGRDPSMTDFCLNVAGAVAGYIVASAIARDPTER